MYQAISQKRNTKTSYFIKQVDGLFQTEKVSKAKLKISLFKIEMATLERKVFDKSDFDIDIDQFKI